jgi:hypothetical protein
MWRLYFTIRNWLDVETGMETARGWFKRGKGLKEGEELADFNVECPNKQGK